VTPAASACPASRLLPHPARSSHDTRRGH
jgi:hypothetical protein